MNEDKGDFKTLTPSYYPVDYQAYIREEERFLVGIRTKIKVLES